MFFVPLCEKGFSDETSMSQRLTKGYENVYFLDNRLHFQMKIRIHNKGVVEAVKKSSPPLTPPPAGDMTGSIQIMD